MCQKDLTQCVLLTTEHVCLIHNVTTVARSTQSQAKSHALFELASIAFNIIITIFTISNVQYSPLVLFLTAAQDTNDALFDFQCKNTHQVHEKRRTVPTGYLSNDTVDNIIPLSDMSATKTMRC